MKAKYSISISIKDSTGHLWAIGNCAATYHQALSLCMEEAAMITEGNYSDFKVVKLWENGKELNQ